MNPASSVDTSSLIIEQALNLLMTEITLHAPFGQPSAVAVQARIEAVEALKQREHTLARLWENYGNGTLHVGYCNANHNGPTGVPGCVCPVIPKLGRIEFVEDLEELAGQAVMNEHSMGGIPSMSDAAYIALGRAVIQELLSSGYDIRPPRILRPRDATD